MICIVEASFPHKFRKEIELGSSLDLVRFICDRADDFNLNEKDEVEFVRIEAESAAILRLLNLPFATLSPYLSFMPKIKSDYLELDVNKEIDKDMAGKLRDSSKQAKEDFEAQAREKYKSKIFSPPVSTDEEEED